MGQQSQSPRVSRSPSERGPPSLESQRQRTYTTYEEPEASDYGSVGMYGEESVRGRMQGTRFGRVYRKATPDETRTRGGENLRNFLQLPRGTRDYEVTMFPSGQVTVARKSDLAKLKQRETQNTEFQEYAKTHDYPSQLGWLYRHTEDAGEKARYKALAAAYWEKRNWWESLTPQEQLEQSLIANPELRTEENLSLLKPLYEAENVRMASEYFYKGIGYPQFGGKYAPFTTPPGQTVESVKEVPTLAGYDLTPSLQVTFKAPPEKTVWVPTSMFGPKIGYYDPVAGVGWEEVAPNTRVKTVGGFTGGGSVFESQAILGMSVIEGMIIAGSVTGMVVGRVQSFLANREALKLERSWSWTSETLGMSKGKPAYVEVLSKESFLSGESLSRSTETVRRVEPWFRMTRGTPQTPMSETLARVTRGTMLSDYLGGYPEVALKQPAEVLTPNIKSFLPELGHYPEVGSRFVFPLIPLPAFATAKETSYLPRSSSALLLQQPQRLRSGVFAFPKLEIGISQKASENMGLRSVVFSGVGLKSMQATSTLQVQRVSQRQLQQTRQISSVSFLLPPLPKSPDMEDDISRRRKRKGKSVRYGYRRIKMSYLYPVEPSALTKSNKNLRKYMFGGR